MKVDVVSVARNTGEAITIGFGRDEDGKPVIFAGDWRPMRNIAEAIKAGENVGIVLEPWQVLAS